MLRVRETIVLAFILFFSGIPFSSAGSRPMEQLPKDILRWSTLWMKVSQGMYDVHQEDGPLAAVTWGPAKGTGMFLYSMGKELWDGAKPDERPGHRSRQDSSVKGVIFSYEF